MPEWLLIPGVALLAASYVIQFASFLRRPRSFGWVGTAIRLRFIGFGVLFLGVGIQLVIRSLLSGPEIAMVLIGLFVIAMAGTWFYAASDKIFRVGFGGPPGPANSRGSRNGPAHDRH